MKVGILIPFAGGGCTWREQAFAHVLGRYRDEHPDWPVTVGTCAGAWSKGEAVTAAYAEAARVHDPDVVVLADADSFVDPAALSAAAAAVERDGWAVPHRYVYRITSGETQRVLKGFPPRRAHLVRRQYVGPAGGGITVLSRRAFDAVGGIDPRFMGWGGEDIALGWALGTLVGPGRRIGTPLWCLWHPHPAPGLRGCPETEALAGRYRQARGKPVAMADLVAEHAGIRSAAA